MKAFTAKAQKHGRNKKYKVDSLFTTNIITCNKTLSDGSVVNVLEDNAETARERVDNIKL